MKKIIHEFKYFAIIVTLMALCTACTDHDDFPFSGTVVDYEICTGISSLGYAVCLTSPDTIGGRYTTQYNEVYDNVVVIYGADRMFHENETISGRIYLDHNYSKSECSYHREREDVPEAVFTKID